MTLQIIGPNSTNIAETLVHC